MISAFPGWFGPLVEIMYLYEVPTDVIKNLFPISSFTLEGHLTFGRSAPSHPIVIHYRTDLATY